ncbi:YeaH/YhbH family protein [Robbsia andropogonis]|uniref:YeaH/YhbH family protein n=1 Tax=Robbsia andropogonis TaxID=28092 RepID=UPI0020A201E6|nr:YeaH/YhbH family protein [Robbsia andropogonis]MCP1118422.1 YeaH/YhbH family protein [Robbsia andropogonis]MCP1127798.1 YeaH/YhbH family protein [Robbsia andropogonis]
MLPQIIDRRLSGKNKSIANRERFLRRFRSHIRGAVTEAIRDRGIKDIEKSEKITIPRRDVSEPVFGHGPGGTREMVHPGNSDYMRGDRIQRPNGGGGGAGSGSGQASKDGEGEDEFAFELSREEFMQYFFEDLELPRMIANEFLTVPNWKSVRAGYAAEGTPNNIHIVRSLRGALGRRIALGGPLSAEVREMKERLQTLERAPAIPADPARLDEIKKLKAEIIALEGRIARIPFIDPFDLRYVNRTRQSMPSSQAVMFCVMDVSGSMDEQRKDLSKRFFILLYLFLTRNYERIEMVFIRHHTRADEVNEETFFHSRESGGTVVSSALELMAKIIEERYSPNEWNIYGAQASDGDNWNDDSPKCRQLLSKDILPACRYFAYIQVAPEEQNLWQEYEQMAVDHPQFAMKKVQTAADIYPVFRELFEKRANAKQG